MKLKEDNTIIYIYNLKIQIKKHKNKCEVRELVFKYVPHKQ